MSTAIKFTKIFYNNEWHHSAGGAIFPTVNPATEEVLTQVQEGREIDIDRAVAAAKAAFKFGSEWRTTDASKRGRMLSMVADLLEDHGDSLARLEALDSGKTETSARGDVEFAASVLRYFGGWADKMSGVTSSPDGDFVAYTRLEPVGVVGAISPWNYPLILAVLKMAPALAAGCCVVLKPAEQTPLSALVLADLCQQVGFPPGVVNVVPGYGPTAGAALARHPDVNKVTFTGSTEVGHLIMQYAGQSNLKRLTLELGGKSPLIVFADAHNLDEAADVAVNCCMTNHGQCCVAGTRTFVQEEIYDVMIQKFKERAEKRIVGNQFDPKTVQGPQIDGEQLTKIMDLIESGKKEGATLVTGGSRIGKKGFFVQPTVFGDVKDDMRIAREEIFGPVQSVFKFKTLEEVIERANDTEYGLGAGVFTSDINKALMLTQALQAGSVWVNCYDCDLVTAPFGGFKKSGIGREYGKYGMEAYTEVKNVTIAIPQKNS